MKKVNPRIEIPILRVAMITTKVPGAEPLSLVQKTLTAMLSQKFPYKYDVWLGDEKPDKETITWCKKNKVKIYTRFGDKKYNRDIWPRKAKTKEGNLAYFYDHFGYKNYDVVVQLDTDHVPNKSYLKNMLRPFVNSKVGYVAAPSIADGKTKKSWYGRGRLYSDAIMHSAYQSGYSNGISPLCFGSHYAVRTSALKQIGGIGPELGEDHSTSLMMNHFGWEGAFAINAIAHGDGPLNFGDGITQEFQWSRTIAIIFVSISKKYLGGLGVLKKIQFVFLQTWYLIYSLSLALSLLLPVIMIAFNAPSANVSYLNFLYLFFVPQSISWSVMYLLKRWKILRPINTKLFSWESILYIMTRWVWMLIGTFAGVYSEITKKKITIKVTPKSVGNEFSPLPIKSILPYYLISIVSILLGIILKYFGSFIETYYLLLVSNSAFYLLITILVIFLHYRQSNKQVAIPFKQIVGSLVVLFIIFFSIT